MTEAHLEEIVHKYSDIVERIERLEISEEDQVEKLKAKIVLFDGTYLWVREIWIKGTLEAYSYYWLRPDDTIMMGWDNAPHHQEINSFPHHRHVGRKIEVSEETDLGKKLAYIRDFFR